MTILLVGRRGGTNIGGCFERSAVELGHSVHFVEANLAMEAPACLRRFNWHLLGHRPKQGLLDARRIGLLLGILQ